MTLKFKTNGFNCYNIQFCPLIPNRFGCVSSQNFGIGGKFNFEMSCELIFLIDRIGSSVCGRYSGHKLRTSSRVPSSL